jgi:hypothetical protein
VALFIYWRIGRIAKAALTWLSDKSSVSCDKCPRGLGGGGEAKGA